MQKSFLLSVCICLVLLSAAQEDIKNYVKQNTIRVSTINPDSIDFSDLESIGDAIGESTIVMLGEQDHGDAPAFLAKTRLVKYLHQKKGFKVLAFESDFFALNDGWDNLNKEEKEIDTFLRKNIFPLWTSCDACQQLFYETIPQSYQTKDPIFVTGIDNQMYLTYSNKKLLSKLDSVMRSLKLPITGKPGYTTDVLPLIDTLIRFPFAKKGTAFYDKLMGQLHDIKMELGAKTDSTDFWSMVLDNLIQTTIEFRYLGSDHYKSYNARDIQMARNLKWLTTVKFPNDKIIVWAHNYHISKYGGNYPEDFLNLAHTMGTEFTRDPAQENNTYIIGFTSNEGTAGRILSKPFSIQNPAGSSMENWVPSELAYGFINFKKFNLQHSGKPVDFKMKGSIKGVHRNHQAPWTKIFDGVFYIKQMYPCKVIR